jgi:hypothetical protein
MLSIPLALLAGAFTVVAPEAYKKTVTTRNISLGNRALYHFQTLKTKLSSSYDHLC